MISILTTPYVHPRTWGVFICARIGNKSISFILTLDLFLDSLAASSWSGPTCSYVNAMIWKNWIKTCGKKFIFNLDLMTIGASTPFKSLLKSFLDFCTGFRIYLHYILVILFSLWIFFEPSFHPGLETKAQKTSSWGLSQLNIWHSHGLSI